MALDYKIIGDRIKSKRIEKKYSQKDIANELEVSTVFVSRMENGTAKVNLNRLVQISKYLDVPLTYFLTGSITESKDYLTKDFDEVLKKCTPEQQRLILNIAKLLIKSK